METDDRRVLLAVLPCPIFACLVLLFVTTTTKDLSNDEIDSKGSEKEVRRLS